MTRCACGHHDAMPNCPLCFECWLDKHLGLPSSETVDAEKEAKKGKGAKRG
jgi:hypothetical protein